MGAGEQVMRPQNLKTKAAALAALARGEWLSVRQISQRIGADYDLTSHYLLLLRKSGQVERRKETVDHLEKGSSTCFVYRAAGAPYGEGQIAPAAHREIPAGNLTGYDRTLHSFRALCMLTRR